MRLTPLPEEQWDERTRQVLAMMLPASRHNPRGAGNLLATLVRHPDLTESFLPFSARLLMNSTLPPRLRELVILRVAHRNACAYEWAHHVKFAARAGLSEAEIEAAGRGEATEELEVAILAAVDELETTSNVTESIWNVLAKHLDEQQLMDLVFTVGSYRMTAMVINAFGIEPD